MVSPYFLVSEFATGLMGGMGSIMGDTVGATGQAIWSANSCRK
jgi:hypothetical protein